MKYLAFLPIALLATSLSFAASADTLRNGNYALAFDGGQGSLRIADGHASLSVGSRSCLGSVGGAVSMLTDRVATFTDRQDGRSCTIHISLDEDGQPLGTESAGPDCGFFHGASCGFWGEVTGPEVPVAMTAITAGFNALPPEGRRAVQEVLSARGLYRGAIDGVVGPGTRVAIVEMARAELAASPRLALNLESEATVHRYLLTLTHSGPQQSTLAPQPVSKPIPASGVDAGVVTQPGVAVTDAGADRAGATWTGDWHCATELFDRPAHFTFTERNGTIHNLGRTVSHGGAQPIGGRENALLIEFTDGERFGLFEIQPETMVIAGSSGIFDCTR
ncbi:MAG TPA: hypothetical protein GX700_00205 [Paracoccus sp.]|nr:hypothetical protein [Paracoccus sp. (in: a-proteobacteria)]